MTLLRGTSYRGGRAILDPGRAGRAKIKKVHKVCSCGVQDLSNEPLPIALPALLGEQLRSLLSLLYDKKFVLQLSLYWSNRRFSFVSCETSFL